MKGIPRMADSYLELLSWHAAHIRSIGHIEFGATILRTRSKALHDVLAYIATDEKYTVLQLKRSVIEGTFYEIEFRNLWLATLGRVLVIQALEEANPEVRVSDLEFGMTCLKHANRKLPRNQEHQQFHRLEIEILKEKARLDEVRKLLEANEYLNNFFYGYLASDIDNPAISRNQETHGDWITGFNRPFTENGLLPIKLSTSLKPTFNDLRTESVPVRTGGPKVSVVMTSYMPVREDFFTAVNSILSQSWRNLELIIVDDASSSEYEPLLAEAESRDSRVRVIRLKENGGTYRARNAGIVAATGSFITGQDSDDWSHPERIAHQIEYLLANPSARGVIVEAIRVDNALVRTFPGRIPHGPCEVSFMLSAELAREVGGYLETRKGADGEFRRRVEKYTGTKIEILKKPLYVIRVGHESLSREDFKPGWSHPVRRAFWNSSRYWHETTPRRELRLTEARPRPIPIPNRFSVHPRENASYYDIVYVGDWRADTGTQRSMIDEIIAHLQRGLKVGILHMESIMSPSKESTRFFYEIQTMINKSEVALVIPDEGASTSLAVVHDPTVLQFASPLAVDFTADLLVIKPDIPPPAPNAPVMYLPKDCDNNARRIFGSSKVVWGASDPAVMRNLARYNPEIELYDELCPIAFRLGPWYNTRRRLRNAMPVIGRHSVNHEWQWPSDISKCLELWPADGSRDVRIMGDARAFLRKFSKNNYPADWVVYRDNDIQPAAFMSSLDFFIYFPADNYAEEFCREALEAAASGAVVILPHRYEKTHGDAALYASPDQLHELINRFVAAPQLFNKAVKNNHKHLQKTHPNSEFLKYFDELRSRYRPHLAQISESDA